MLHLDLQSLQSDAIIAQWFSQWGIVSRQEEDGVVIEFKEFFDCQKNTITSGNENDFQNEESKLDKTESQAVLRPGWYCRCERVGISWFTVF